MIQSQAGIEKLRREEINFSVEVYPVLDTILSRLLNYFKKEVF
jgi:hypothetical protein